MALSKTRIRLFMGYKRFVIPALLISVFLVVSAAAQDTAQDTAKPRPHLPPQVKDLIAKLPECSALRRWLQQGRFGDGVQKPYMRPMAEHGVQRAYFEVVGKWRHGHADGIRIMRRLYFRRLDGPDAQITKAATLEEIKSSGLEAILDEAVQARARTAVLFAGIDRWAGFGIIHRWQWQLGGGKVYGAMEFFATPWLSPFLPNWILPSNRKYRENLGRAAAVGDVIALAKLLRTQKYSQPELNDGLNSALVSPWDNTAAIELLIKAGADVNAGFGGETTPLMQTYECPCDIPVLLKHGARVDARDKWGKTALDQARERHDVVAERLLESAAAAQ